MKVMVVACPVAHREWIIRHWADHAVVSCANAGFEPWFVLGAHPTDPTPGALRDHLAGSHAVTVAATDVVRHEDRRTWNEARFAEMVTVRNTVLAQVRELRPSMLLSVDSDVLLHPDAVAKMVTMLDDYDAAGTACFLSHPPRWRSDGQLGTPQWIHPNYSMLTRRNRLQRSWRPDVTRRVDVLMAIKLMAPAAYWVDYQVHEQGEDTGWSIACRQAGLHLGWASTVVSKHVMSSHCDTHSQHHPTCVACVEPISRLDPRCGY